MNFYLKMMTKAIDNNVVVTYEGAKIDYHFVGIMLDHAYRLQIGRLTNLYIPTGIVTYGDCQDYICGLKIIKLHELNNMDGELFSYYIKNECRLPYRTYNLILAASCDNAILGAI